MTDRSYIIIGISFLLLVFLVRNEILRPGKARMAWRVLAVAFAVISIACMALPMHYTEVKITGSTKEAVLLTEGFDQDSLTHFLSVQQSASVFTFDEKLVTSKKYNTSLLTDPHSLVAKDFTAIHIFGNGYQKETLDALKKLPLIFHPSVIAAGVTAINWSPKINAGAKLYVQGAYTNTSSSSKKLILSGFGTTLDSVMIPANKTQQFQLATIPKTLGRMVYTMLVSEGKAIIEKEPVPVEIVQSKPLQVLMLVSAPDFETKFLKTWLAQRGYGTVVRTAISKNKYNKEYLNTTEVNINTVTPALLDKFDVIVTDASELASISKQELGNIQTAITQKGKGMIFRMDSSGERSSFYASVFPIVSAGLGQQQPVQLVLSDSALKLHSLSIDLPLFIRTTAGTQPLLADKQNRIFVNSTLYGSGKIIVTTLPNTFKWALSGNQEDYDNVWTQLLHKAAPVNTEEETWRISPSMPRINSKVSVILQSAVTGIPKAIVANTTIYLENNYQLPYEWKGSFWPSGEGWQTGIQLNGHIYYWYAYGRSDWKYVSAFDNIQLAKEYEKDPPIQKATINTDISASREVEVKKIYFFLIFLLCSGYLWFENKYYKW